MKTENKKQVSTVKKVTVQGFDEWMLKIKNIHYADNVRMEKAYNRL